jgi:hypothetical protein
VCVTLSADARPHLPIDISGAPCAMAPNRASARKCASQAAVVAAAQRAKIALDLARSHAQEEAYEKDM